MVGFHSSETLICCCNLGCNPASSEGRHQGYSSIVSSEWGTHPNPLMLQRVNTTKAEEGWAAGKKEASTNSQELHLQESFPRGYILKLFELSLDSEPGMMQTLNFCNNIY